MPTPEKVARVALLRAEVEAASGIYLSAFGGIPVSSLSRLRDKMLESGATLEVVKNRLMKLALMGTPGEALCEHLTGPTIVAFCKTDPFAPAKVMKEFARGLVADKQTWLVKAAYVEGRLFEEARAQALAELPPINEIKSSLVGAIQGPASALVGTLNGALSDLVYTLQAIADKREEAGQ
jgi:large subunit ribosomal protein L10